MILKKGRGWFITDPRYAEQAAEQVKGPFTIRVFKRKGLVYLARTIKRLKPSNLGFEKRSVSYSTYLDIRRSLRGTGVSLKPTSGIVEELRQSKDPGEVGLIQKAAGILDAGFRRAVKVIKPGVAERDAAFEIERFMRGKGAEGLSFETIVASGARSALPHGKASGKKIKKGELVVLDMGAKYMGYNSDGTRTFCTGRPTGEQKKIYRVVLEAQEKALEKIKAGVKGSEVDRAARAHIEKAGFGKNFGHGTGHGVGLDIHEPPSLGPESGSTLEEGMVVTVEPGVYVPGVGGVRIEDMVVVEKDGCRLLTNTPKDELLSV